MLVSIVMPSFNQGEFIEQSVRSVLNQDFSSVELIVADGGSTDGTTYILQGLEEEYGDQLVWTSEPDTGPAAAINKAIKLSRGEIIGWLNSDDLYVSGAIDRAVDALSCNARAVLVYGEGDYIDEQGSFLKHYPTKDLSASLDDFQQGCYICQPTVFLRRSVFDEVGLLDEGIKTAFDFELWLRIFKNYPNQIAYVDNLQAYSRLHDRCITQSQRELVAVEGMAVLARHLGYAQSHWLSTYFEELCQKYPFSESPDNLQAHILTVIKKVSSCLSAEEIKKLNGSLLADMRWEITLPDVYVDIYPDGWASSQLKIKIRHSANVARKIILYCQYNHNFCPKLSLDVVMPWLENKQNMIINSGADFAIVLSVPAFSSPQEFVVNISCNDIFVPMQMEEDSLDARELTFRVCKVGFEENYT